MNKTYLSIIEDSNFSFKGDLCGSKCPNGKYGYNCSQTCINCLNGAVCDHVNGSCTCAPGYQGHRQVAFL